MSLKWAWQTLMRWVTKAWRLAARLLRRFFTFEEEFWGVCANSIHGRVNVDEAIRVAIKSFSVAGGTWLVNAHKLVTDPDFQTAVIVPVAAGFVAGWIEYKARKAQGAATPPPPASGWGTRPPQ